MALSALDDLSAEPGNDQVAAVLGVAMDAWRSLQAWLNDSAGVDQWEWGSSGKQYGWGPRAKMHKRVIVYLIPQHGCSLVGLVLGDRALRALEDVPLSPVNRDAISNAKSYAEGTGFRLRVAELSDLEDIKMLVRIKIEH